MDNTKKLVDFLATLSDSVDNALQDGKISFADVGDLIPVVQKVMPLIKAFPQIDDEIFSEQFSPEVLKQYIRDSFAAEGDVNDAAESLAESVVALWVTWVDIQELLKAVKGIEVDTNPTE